MAQQPARLASIIEHHRGQILALAAAHKARSVAVFGSVARGDDNAGSDVDLLVEFEEGSSLFDLMRLEDALCALLGCRVDVVAAGALLERDEDIRRDLVPL